MLASIMRNGDKDATRVAARRHPARPRLGRAPQSHAGEVDKDVRIVIRNIVAERR